MIKNKKLRIARPSNNLAAIERFYGGGLGFEKLAHFEDHAGIDGIMLGHHEAPYHFEFTKHRHLAISPAPTKEDLVVFYIPDSNEWNKLIKNLSDHGFFPVPSLNPYWDKKGKTFEDPDGYRVVIQNADWG